MNITTYIPDSDFDFTSLGDLPIPDYDFTWSYDSNSNTTTDDYPISTLSPKDPLP